MTNYNERLDEILRELAIDAWREGLNGAGSSETSYWVGEAKQAIDRLFLDAVGEDDAYDEFCSECSDWDDGRNDLRQQLRTTITGKEGGDE